MDFSDFSRFVPDVVDPALAYLESVLPPPVYSALLTGCSTILALSAPLLSLLSESPLTWTAEKFIPPIITLLTAYLALSSLYRTIRLTFWFIKWGTILAAMIGCVSWFMSGGVTDLLAVGDGGGTTGSSSSRPRAWDSWNQHDSYRQQRRQQARGQDGVDDVQKYIQELTGVAGRVFAQSGDWWETAKGIVEELGKQPRGNVRDSTGRKTKLKSGKTAGTR